MTRYETFDTIRVRGVDYSGHRSVVSISCFNAKYGFSFRKEFHLN